MQQSAVACLGAPTKLAVTPVAHSTPRPAQQPGPPRQNRSGSRLPGPCAHQHGSSSSSAAANRRRRMCARVLPGAGDASALPQEDASIRVKIMLAESSGRLDLSECGLQAVPAAVFELEGLEELSLAGNQLEQVGRGGPVCVWWWWCMCGGVVWVGGRGGRSVGREACMDSCGHC